MVRVTGHCVVGIAVAVSLTACGGGEKPDVKDLLNGQSPAPTALMGDPSACAHVDGPWVDIPAAADSEPVMRIPQPPGWDRNTELDSELVRFVLVNTDLTADQFAPNVVVTVEDAPPTDPRTIYEQARRNLVKLAGATDVVSAPADVCGLPAETVTYRGAATGPATAERSLTTLYVATRDGDRSKLISVTIQTTEPDNPTYQRDAARMLDGFEVLPASPVAPQ
ncbi:LpqN/LpqT family lipoprotein [Mycolicibacterium sp. S2-37]|uniref:LpqN/LpqT family lipoprotein n=1 Tax=Mycolicibacterium sp. S2-37 TaxID=2810297 RepID=UPI001A93F000|nr:LpqN/LpqT family lipoprotein [Mycolicibacterium sp. S2-37]MBO0677479.1 LpqN/LpqT family lipoprotein [Mycolicibacterium sp. S2-37]